MGLNPQAQELNDTIASANPHVASLLSKRGKAAFFPRKGIITQTGEAKKAGINATIGSALEDDGSPMCLEVLQRNIKLDKSEVFPYARPFGRDDIREAWNRMMLAKNPSLKNTAIGMPVVTHALTHGMTMTGYLFLEEGEQVILPDLYWGNYRLILANGYGASFDTYPTFEGEGFNVDGLKNMLLSGKPRKRIVVLNFPNNPTGYTVTEEEARRLRDALVEAAEAGNDILVIVDDAYFGLVYKEGVFRESMFSLLASAHERILAVKLDGPTKEDYVWGFRVGFLTFGTARSTPAMYQALEAKLGGAIRGTISNASNLSQALLNHAYGTAEYEQQKEEKYQTLRRRYERICAILEGHPEYGEVFVPLPFNSGYFMCVRITDSLDAEEMRRKLLTDYSTGVIAMNGILRVAFSSTPTDKLEELFANIYRAGKELS